MCFAVLILHVLSISISIAAESEDTKYTDFESANEFYYDMDDVLDPFDVHIMKWTWLKSKM